MPSPASHFVSALPMAFSTWLRAVAKLASTTTENPTPIPTLSG
jgi:hypothetical protein